MMKELIEHTKKYLVTEEEFQNLLENFLTSHFQDRVHVQYVLSDKDGQEYLYGKKGEGSPDSQVSYNFQDGYKVKVELWKDNFELEQDDLEKLFKEYWNEKFCDNVCGLPTTSNGDFEAKCNATITKWKQENKSIAFVMMDLDHFKDVNTKYNHTIGTSVISEFSRILFRKVHGNGILIHQSGDEFNLILPYERYTEIVELMFSIRELVNKHIFSKAPDLNLTLASGVWLISSGEEVDYKSIRNKAEETYDPKKRNGSKQRDSIRINTINNYSQSFSPNLKLGIIRLFGNIYNDLLFHNIYLDYISYMISNISNENDIQKRVNTFLQWLNPKYDSKMRCIQNEKRDTIAEISYVDIGFSVLQGIAKNQNIVKSKLGLIVKKGELSVELNQYTILRYEDSSIEGEIAWESKKYCEIPSNIDVRKTVLVQAGYTTLVDLPEDIFSCIVRVDARPSIGGGLPDLWTATLSALVKNMQDNDCFDDIVIYGDVNNINKVKYYLDSIQQWDEETIKYLSKKTYKSYGDILKFKNKFSDSITTLQNIQDIVEYMFSRLDNIQVIEKKDREECDNKKRFLNRILPYEKLKLQILDGFRTDTIAHAFPITLEILRNNQNKNNVIIDQAGRELLELTDFKILLETPRIDKLPEYYFYDEEELNRYYESIFVSDEGLFRKKIEKNNQLEEMLKHVVVAITGEHEYATRRAILVVENEVQIGNNYSPLGLVSIWLAPRFVGKKVVIDYSYTWRTVEALVGLPLSMYASIMYAENLTNQIINKTQNSKCDVEMGTVSYLAHSLHMFTDTESMNIVRGIINEVSI